MKSRLLFFFLLLIFSQCNNTGESPPPFRHDQQQHHHHQPQQRSRTAYKELGARGSPRAMNVTVPKPIANPRKVSKQRGVTRQIPLQPTRQVIFRDPTDSIFIKRLQYLRSGGIELDLNEPVSRNFLISPIENQQFPTMITLSREAFLKINFDNDILDYTDRFYTNGIKIELISPALQMNPIGRLMIPYWGSGKNYYGLTLVQNMYTPSTTKTGGILYGDRPYAAYLYLGCFKITNDPVHKFRQTSELDLGIIGPNSYGEWVQRSFHNSVPTNNEPLGWEYQIQNDLVLNYSIAYEKGILSCRNLDLNITSTGNIGTLYTNFSGGIQFRTGWINPYFANLGIARKAMLKEQGLRKFQFFFFIKGSGKLVGYDATLEGGLLNRSSSYTIPPGEISRVVFQGSGGISVSSGGFRFDIEQYLLSPDFHNGWWHKWVHLALVFCI